MSRVGALLLDREQAKLDEAIASANQWLVTARPVIKAMFAIEDAEWDIRQACDDRTGQEVLPILRKPVRELRELVDGIRDNFLCDVTPSHAGLADDDADGWDARDAFIDEVGRSVLSVDAAIKLVGDEM